MAQNSGLPWGISESAYNARDLEFTYQYSNFGVPGLGLKRGLGENRVIAPYATGLATMVDPSAAVTNFKRLATMGARGRYGFYEAVDFTPTRVQEGETLRARSRVHGASSGHDDRRDRQRVVRRRNARAIPCRADHSGDGIVVAGAGSSRGRCRPGLGRRRSSRQRAPATSDPSGGRKIVSVHQSTPSTLLLSNGRYAVMLTAAGSGYSRWGDIAITRWREDATRDD